MDELILRSLMGETSPEEERRLMAWRSADPEHDARYRSLLATWELAGQALKPPTRQPPSVEAVLGAAAELENEPVESRVTGRTRDAARSADGAADEAGSRPRARGRSFPVRRAAWAGGLAAAAVLTVLLVRDGAEVPPPVVETTTVVAEQPRTIHLSDGSFIRMAGGATLRYEPTRPRNVWLEGRAFFGVAASPDDPFFVQTPSGVTRVLGTRFDVRAAADRLEVVVVEGRVRVLTPAGRAEVGTGEQIRALPDTPPEVVPADPEALTGWMEDVFMFQDTPLSRALQELERRHGKRLVVVDSALADRTVTAVFDDHTLQQILPALCRAVSAECIEAGDTVLFTLRSPLPNQ